MVAVDNLHPGGFGPDSIGFPFLSGHKPNFDVIVQGKAFADDRHRGAAIRRAEVRRNSGQPEIVEEHIATEKNVAESVRVRHLDGYLSCEACRCCHRDLTAISRYRLVQTDRTAEVDLRALLEAVATNCHRFPAIHRSVRREHRSDLRHDG